MKVECTVGIELETVYDKDRSVFQKLLPKDWKVVSDGSIPGSGGWEAVSNIMTEDEAIGGIVSETIANIIANGGSYIDAPHEFPATKIEDLPAFKSIRYWCKQAKLAKKNGNDKYRAYANNQLKELSQAIKEQWADAVKVQKKQADRKARKAGDRQSACGFHVHISVKDNHPLPKRPKQIAAIIYSFYYKRYIENILVESRQDGGSASQWASSMDYDDSMEISRIHGSKYESVNLASGHGTVEYRQGSVNQYTSPEKWVSLLCDITRGAFQIHTLYPDIKTVGEVKALLPYKLKSFRLKTWNWAMTEEDEYKPETFPLGAKIPKHVIEAAEKAAKAEKKRLEAERKAKLEAERLAREAELAANPVTNFASNTEAANEMMRRLELIRSRGLCAR